jgi:hypothetical protein
VCKATLFDAVGTARSRWLFGYEHQFTGAARLAGQVQQALDHFLNLAFAATFA